MTSKPAQTYDSSSEEDDAFENASSDVLPSNDVEDSSKSGGTTNNSSTTDQRTATDPDETLPADDNTDIIACRQRYEATLTPAQLETKKDEATLLKAKGNELFKGEDYTAAVETYTEAIELCPLHCAQEQAVLHGNRAAANLQLNNKAAAIVDCTRALELNPKYLKVLIRRAKLYEDTDKLDESLEDYKQILELDPQCGDARQALHRLPGKIDERNEKLKTEMLGKLKDLGNMILKPFGLSTNNFQMQQDPSSGSYSVNFNQNPSK